MGTFVTVYQGSGGRVDLEYTLTPSIENNTTSVAVVAHVVKTNSSYYSYRTAPQAFTLTVNGVAQSIGWTFDFRNMTLNQRYTIMSNTQVVAHNTDGSRANVSASVYCATGTDGLGTINGSASIPIPIIPRASTPTLSASSLEMGANLTIYSNRASLNFTHTLTYSFGGASGTIATDVADNYTWTVPLSLAHQVPNATSGTGTITCYTYSGGSLIGTKTVSFGATVPASIKPVINSVTKTEAVSGIAAQFAAYVQNKSQLAVNVSYSEAYSSPIISCTTSILGSSYSGASFTSNVLTSAGDVGITTTITDSRGRTATSSSIINVVAYSAPTITSFGAVRALSNGTESATEGTYLKAAMAFSVSSVGDKNTKSWTLSYRLAGGSWSDVTSGSTYSYNSSFTSATGILGVDSAYEARLTVADWFTSTTASVPISTAFVLMDFHAAGTGIGIGKVATGNGVLDIAGDVYIDSLKINGANTMPGGDDSLTYWHSLKQGRYFCGASSLTNQPSAYGLVDVIKMGADEFNVIWYTQASGAVYRKSGNSATQTAWVNIAAGDYLPLAGGTVSGDITASSMYTSSWFRSTGATGWYNQTYNGGIHMQDTTYVRVYGKKFLSDYGLMAGSGTDIELYASGSSPNDSGDLVFRSSAGAELGRIYQANGTMMSRGSGGNYDGVIRNVANCNIAYGTVSLTYNAWTTVNFYMGFGGAPKVVMSADSSTVSGTVNEPKVKNVTASGFEATVSGTGQACTYSWIAIWSAY